MPDELADIRERQDGLEDRVATLEANADTEAAARAGMDRDLSDLQARFRVQEELMKAARETASDQHRTLVRLETTQIRHTAILDRHTAILDRHTGILAKLQVGMKMIVGLLGGDVAALDGADGDNAGGSPENGSAEN